MARGGRRTYVRDSRGRFAGTPGGGAQAKGGTLGARSSLKKSRSKLASKDSADQSLRGTLSRRSQKGAVTRGSKALKEAKASSRARLVVGGPASTIAKRRGLNQRAQKVVKSPKLSQSQRFTAKRAKDAFNDDTLLLNGRLAKGYKEGVQAVQKKFGVDNRIATKVLMKYGHRMGTSDIQYVNPAKAKKSIKAMRATTKVGGQLGGQKTGKRLTGPQKIKGKPQNLKQAQATRKAPKSFKAPTIKGVMKPPKIKLQGEGGEALRKVMNSVPTVPKGRQPLSKDKAGQMLDVGFGQSMRLGGRQRSALEKELQSQGFSSRSNALGGVRTYSKQFAAGNKNPRSAAEIITVQVQSKGGPLVGGTVSTKRTVFAPSYQRNVGGRLMERAYGLPVKARKSTKPRKRKP
jgi:hypothetical protein